jgi:hypothetical protein
MLQQLLTPIWLTVVLLPVPSLGQQRPVAEKLSQDKMTQGLTNQRADGTAGINYQGGVAGYAGRMRDGSTIGTDVTSPEQLQTNVEANIARQKAAIERQRAELIEQQKRQRIQQYQAAQREAVWAQTQDTSNLNAHDLARLCESKGMGVDHGSNTCIQMGGFSRGGGSIAVWERPRNVEPQNSPAQTSPGGSPTGLSSFGSGPPTRSARSNSGDLLMACAAKGFTADFATGNCVSPQGRQTNPLNLYPPFAAPLPKPEPPDLIMRCGAMARVADFATGRCM